MKLKTICSLLILLTFAACSALKTKHTDASLKVPATFHAKNLLSDSGGMSHFECDEFVSNALNNFTINVLSCDFKNQLKCTKEFVKNVHDTITVDTIYTFSDAQNKIQIYRAKLNDFIIKFEVKDSIFILPGNIKTGISKDEFSKKFVIIEKLNNKVQINTNDGSMKLTFYFENNILKSIRSRLYLD